MTKKVQLVNVWNKLGLALAPTTLNVWLWVSPYCVCYCLFIVTSKMGLVANGLTEVRPLFNEISETLWWAKTSLFTFDLYAVGDNCFSFSQSNENIQPSTKKSVLIFYIKSRLQNTEWHRISDSTTMSPVLVVFTSLRECELWTDGERWATGRKLSNEASIT